MKSFFRKLTWLMRRPDKEAELREELQFHLDEEAAERHAQGLAEAEARRAARRELGNVALVQEDTRAIWTWTFGEQLIQDIRYGLRTIAANKTFSAMAILSLALGIGANTAIFSFMDSILLRSLPVPDAHSLVMLSWHTPHRDMHGSNRHDNSYNDPSGGFIGGFFAYPAFELLRKNDAVFSSVFGYQSAGDLNLTIRGQAELANTEYVSGDYFRGVGIPPASGRLIAPDDDRASASSTAVISFALSQRRFGGPENAPGQSILINNLPFTVIGVAPPEFFGVDPDSPPDIYVPMHVNVLLESRDYSAETYFDPYYDWVVPMARLRPGVSTMQAQAALAGPFHQWVSTARPKSRDEDLPALVVREGSGGLDGLRRTYSKPLSISSLRQWALILSTRLREYRQPPAARAPRRASAKIALRPSLARDGFGSSANCSPRVFCLPRWAGRLGCRVRHLGNPFPDSAAREWTQNFTLRAGLNWRVLAVVAGLSLLTGVLFGLAPALQSTRVDFMPALKESRTGEARRHGFRRFGLSRILMVSQIAVTLPHSGRGRPVRANAVESRVHSTRVQSREPVDVPVERPPGRARRSRDRRVL